MLRLLRRNIMMFLLMDMESGRGRGSFVVVVVVIGMGKMRYWWKRREGNGWDSNVARSWGSSNKAIS